MTARDLAAAYDAYLERAVALGPVAVGSYAKARGRLVKKLDYDEFVERWSEYEQLRAELERAMADGDTMNDAVLQLLEERAAELLLDVG